MSMPFKVAVSAFVAAVALVFGLSAASAPDSVVTAASGGTAQVVDPPTNIIWD